MFKKKNFFRFIGGLAIIFLIAFTQPVNAYVNEDNLENVLDDIIIDGLNTEVNDTDGNSTEVFNSSDIIQNHILEKAPHVTNGEMLAIYDMMSEQFDTENGNFKFQFYTDYLNDSDEYPVNGLNYTARELYNQSSYYKSLINGIEQIIDNYDHMTSDEKMNFLITKEPNISNAMKCFKTNDRNKLLYLSQSIENFSIPEYDKNIMDLAGINGYKNKIRTFTKDFAHAVLVADKTYDTYNPDFNFNNVSMYNNSAYLETIDKATNKLDGQIKGLNSGGGAMLTVGVILLIIGGVSHYSKVVVNRHWGVDDQGFINQMSASMKWEYVPWLVVLKVILISLGLILTSLAIYFLVLANVHLKKIEDTLISIKEDLTLS